jgi:hypothetical protein
MYGVKFFQRNFEPSAVNPVNPATSKEKHEHPPGQCYCVYNSAPKKEFLEKFYIHRFTSFFLTFSPYKSSKKLLVTLKY